MRFVLAAAVTFAFVSPAFASGPLVEAAALASAGDCDGAVKRLAAAKAPSTDHASVVKLASAAEGCRAKDRVVGFALTERLAELAPADTDAVLAHADSLVAMEQQSEAEALVEKAAAKSPGDGRLKSRRAKLAGSTRPPEAPSTADPCPGLDLPGCGTLQAAALAKSPPDYALAMAIDKKFCDHKIALGCNNLAVYHLTGKGVPPSPVTSAAMSERACEIPDGHGCHELGLDYIEGNGVPKSPAKALQLWKKACDLGDGDGCFELGAAHGNGVIVAKDNAAARAFFKRACDLKASNACEAACTLGDKASCGKHHHAKHH